MKSLTLKEVTWEVDGDAPLALVSRRTSIGQLRQVQVQSCTNLTLICLRVWQLCNPTFP